LHIVTRYLALFLFAGFPATGSLAGPANGPQRDQNAQVIEVTAKKFEFNPSAIHVKRGARVQLKITALDRTHGFKIHLYPDGADSRAEAGLIFLSKTDCFKIDKGSPTIVEFIANTPGAYSVRCCNVCGLGHAGMKGQIVVDP
jgi:cytochrome c oxidase subunit 2